MRKIIFEKYKVINIFLLSITAFGLVYLDSSFDRWFKGPEPLDFYKYYHAIFAPLYSGGLWLAGILGILLFFPAKIFRIWLFFVAPPILLLTYILVSGISVYSGNLLNPTRAQMAENGMILLGIATLILIVVQLFLSWRKRTKLLG